MKYKYTYPDNVREYVNRLIYDTCTEEKIHLKDIMRSKNRSPRIARIRDGLIRQLRRMWQDPKGTQFSHHYVHGYMPITKTRVADLVNCTHAIITRLEDADEEKRMREKVPQGQSAPYNLQTGNGGTS